MIRIETFPKLCSGDKDLLILGLADKGFAFLDNTLGYIVWNGTGWNTSSGSPLNEQELTKVKSDLLFDNIRGYYLNLNAKAVISCMVDNVGFTGQFDKNLRAKWRTDIDRSRYLI